MTWGRILATAALSGVVALVAVPASAGARSAPGGGSTTTTTTTRGSQAVAKLVIKSDSVSHVSVQAAGAPSLNPATDGESLHVGDTVQTDATGRAEIDYSSDAFTRLDVSTTFTIKKLTDNQGNRQVDSSLGSGRTWNRTIALTQSESFQQGGAGSTAAVAGTAFVSACASPTQCTFTAVVDNTKLTGANGQTQTLNPLFQCVSTNGALCAAPSALTATCDLSLIQWIQTNVSLDFVERGIGNGTFQPCTATNGVGGVGYAGATSSGGGGSGGGGSGLALTGSDKGILIGIGAALMAVGVGLTAATRRRRRMRALG